MFYKMIESKRDQWLTSEECTVNSLIDYIVTTGQMRDAQIEAIKTYLFLKIRCENKPLATMFKQGAFNTIDLNSIELSQNSRDYLLSHPAAAALLEYACIKNDKNEQVSVSLEQKIKRTPEVIDYDKITKLIHGKCKNKDKIIESLKNSKIESDQHFKMNEIQLHMQELNKHIEATEVEMIKRAS